MASTTHSGRAPTLENQWNSFRAATSQLFENSTNALPERFEDLETAYLTDHLVKKGTESQWRDLKTAFKNFQESLRALKDSEDAFDEAFKPYKWDYSSLS